MSDKEKSLPPMKRPDGNVVVRKDTPLVKKEPNPLAHRPKSNPPMKKS